MRFTKRYIKFGKRNFSREAFKENEVKMIKITFLQKIVGRDIQQHYPEFLSVIPTEIICMKISDYKHGCEFEFKCEFELWYESEY